MVSKTLRSLVRLLAATLSVITLSSEAPAQSGTLYDSSGRVSGRYSTDSQGTTTYYDATGKVTSRASTSGSTTTIYDPSGRNVGKFTKGTR
jgi:YD repeat-containing protein